MYWHKKKIDYDILIPPINKQFKNFTKKEAESYFEWYKNQLNPRIEYLRKYSGVDLDYSVNSLVDIWGWFLKIAETEKAPKAKTEEVRNRLKSQPKEIIEDVLNEQSRQFSLETEYIIRDIAMYFGEVYVKNNSSIAWGYILMLKQIRLLICRCLSALKTEILHLPLKRILNLCL